MVTGGTGFVGCHVTRLLLAEDCDVTLFDQWPDRDTLGLVAGTATAVRVIMGDVSSAVALFRAVDEIRPEVVVHLASPLPPATERDAAETLRAMVGGHVNVLEAARLWQVRKVVWASATSVFGPPSSHGGLEALIANDAPHHPETVYGVAKSACERLSAVYRSREHVDSVGLRFAQGYGPGKRRGRPFGYELFQKALSGEPYEVPFGDDLINWQYVEDMAAMIVQVSRTEPFLPVVLNTTGEVMTMQESVSLLREICPRARLTVGRGTTGLVWRYDVSELARVLDEFPMTAAREGFAQTLRTMEEWQAAGLLTTGG